MRTDIRKPILAAAAPALIFLLFLVFIIAAFPEAASAAPQADVKHSPLFAASLKNTLREFEEKEGGQFERQLNGAVTEGAGAADMGDAAAGALPEPEAGGLSALAAGGAGADSRQPQAYMFPGVPKIPSIPSIPKIPTVPSVPTIPSVPSVPTVPSTPTVPSYTSSYSCGSTCVGSSTCAGSSSCAGSSTCVGSGSCAGTSTCAGASSCVGASTCFGASSCAGASTCFGTASCSGTSTCAGTSTCVGTNTCVGMSSCAGSATCFGTNTCSGSTCLGTSTCLGVGASCVAPGLPRQPGGVQVGESPGADPSAGPPPDSGQETGESGADATAAEPGDGGASPSPWALDDVNEAIGRRFVPSGLQEKYQSNITRREFCALVAKFLRASASRSGIGDRLGAAEAGESPFTDVDDSAVTLAFGLGVVNGIGDGLFNPDGDITRQEAAIMLANLSRGVLGVESEPPPIGYGDAGSVAEWAQSGVAFVTEHGIMSGVGENAFAPLNPYTREQSILTVLRLSKAFISE